MNIGGLTISAGSAARSTTPQQGQAVASPAHKNRHSAIGTASDQYRSAPQQVIDAEYVDLYSPSQRPPEQLNQWRQLVIEKTGTHESRDRESGADERTRQLIARYGHNSSNLPLPGTFVNLIA